MTDYRVYRPGIYEKVIGVILIALASGVIGVLFYNTPLTVVASPLLIKPCDVIYRSYMVSSRKNRLRVQFRDLLDSLAALFAGGRHMKEALQEAERELSAIYEEDDEIISEIRWMIRKMEEGETDAMVLSDFARRADIEDITLFVQVFTTCRETGGDLISAMTQASSMLGDKIKIENEIRALTSQKKTEGMIISVMPVVIIVFLRMIAPDYVAVLYGNPKGAALMTVSLAAAGFAFYMIRKITDIEV